MSQINLIPAHRQQARKQKKFVRVWAVTVCSYAVVLGMCCMIIPLRWNIDAVTIERDLGETRQKLKQMDAESANMKKQLAQIADARRHVRAVSDHPDWSILLTQLGAMMGTETSLKEIKISPVVENIQVAPTTAPSTQPVREQYVIELRGSGKSQPSVSKFVLQLQATGLFDEVRLVRSSRETKSNDAPVTFDLACTIGDLLQ